MAEVFEVILPIFLITLIGYLFGRSKLELHSATLSTTVIMVALPALIFSSLTSIDISIERLGSVFLAAALCLSLATVMSLIVIKALGFSVQTCLPCLMFPNSGNMGLPLALIAFGDIGLSLGVAYFVVISLVQHTVGMSIASGKYDFGSLVRQPLIYAIIGVLIVILTGVKVPKVIATTTDLLGGLMIPAMLILLGNSLSKLKVSDFGPAFTLAISRLIIGVFSGLLTIWLLDLTGMIAGLVFLLASMPSAVVSYVYAERFRPDPEQIAGTIVVSTLLTFTFLPVLIWIAKAIAEH
ncbi:AEC family transporter [Pacificibacter sp. AS14]|uniref:AEC family transporter n=1 Tax=Pacificibacter sp. AS14 TaxID=3135785 RepID=UPI00317C4E71